MRLLFMIGLVTLFFSGCTGEAAVPVEQARPEHRVEAAALEADLPEVPSFYKGYRPSPHVTDDRKLREPGQAFRDSRGEAVVLKATGEQKRVSAGPGELTIREAKVLRYKPADRLTDHYRPFTGEEEFSFVKLFIEVRNTGDEPVRFDPIAVIGTDTGETLLWEEDIYLEGLDGVIAPGETRAGNVGIILEAADAKLLTVRTGDVSRVNGEGIAAGAETEIRF